MGMSPEAMADRITDYVRIRKAEKRDPEKIHRTLQKGLRIEHPEKIMGYAGYFFDLGDVYASGYVAEQMEDERFRTFVMDSLKQFDEGEYGDISRNDLDENIENRWIFGIDRLFGRYGYDLTEGEREQNEPYFEVICIRKHGENTWVTYDGEADWFLFLRDEDLKLIRDIDLD